ncbi:hypothetical protein P3W45_000777 [Vairimorpha bombi]
MSYPLVSINKSLDKDAPEYYERIKYLNQNVDTNLKDLYREWLTKKTNLMTRLCKTSPNTSCVPSFPKCVVRNTKKFCKCNPECVSDLIQDIFDNTGCKAYDLDQLYDDTEYIDCFGLMYLPNEGSMKQDIKGRNLLQSKIDFFRSLYDTCSDVFTFPKLKCDSTELRDQCLNKPKCLMEAFDSIFPTQCDNENFGENLREIRDFFVKSVVIKDDVSGSHVEEFDAFTNHQLLEFLFWIFKSKRDVSIIGKRDVPVIDKRDVSIIDKRDVPVIGKRDVSIIDKRDVPVIDKRDVSIIGKRDVPVIDKRDVSIIDKRDVSIIGKRDVSIIDKRDVSIIEDVNNYTFQNKGDISIIEDTNTENSNDIMPLTVIGSIVFITILGCLLYGNRNNKCKSLIFLFGFFTVLIGLVGFVLVGVDY